MKILKQSYILFVIALSLGVTAGISKNILFINCATNIADFFVITLKWLSLPIISLSILKTISSLDSKHELLFYGKTIFKYTIITTLIAATVALSLFLIIKPGNTNITSSIQSYSPPTTNPIFGILLISTLILTFISGFTILAKDFKNKDKLNNIIIKLHSSLMYIINKLLILLPIAIWAFITLFVLDYNSLTLSSIAKYLFCILSANLIQAIIVLPSFLKKHNISISKTFKAMFPALNIAFWSKSSGVALPIAIDCAKNRLKLSEKVSNFSLPLCITINMNACAAFILITTLFVSTSNGIDFTIYEYLLAIIITTIAAIGNAGVPMGCYTLSCVLLAYMGVPLYLMGIILPFYSLIDMLESAINVWSDSCVTAIVDKKIISNYK